MKKIIAIFIVNLILFAYAQQEYILLRKNNILRAKTKASADRNGFQKPYIPNGYLDRINPPFTPAWMDYCDPYHCNDYHKTACGLNRKKMRFKMFQSGCHIALNNQCADFRGSLKYDQIEFKHCLVYLMYLRVGCPSDCSKEDLSPVCAYNTVRGDVVLFVNQCAMDAGNCRNGTLGEYEEIDLRLCEHYLRSKIQ